jgi:hypothetical protein
MSRNKARKSIKAQLPEKLELARGMKVLITNNIATDLDIILNPEEPPVGTEAIVQLKK